MMHLSARDYLERGAFSQMTDTLVIVDEIN